jgi:hypothetical protein
VGYLEDSGGGGGKHRKLGEHRMDIRPRLESMEKIDGCQGRKKVILENVLRRRQQGIA